MDNLTLYFNNTTTFNNSSVNNPKPTFSALIFFIIFIFGFYCLINLYVNIARNCRDNKIHPI